MNINGFYSSIVTGLLYLSITSFTVGCNSGGGKERVSNTPPPSKPPQSKSYEFDRSRGCFTESIVNGTVAASTNPLTSHVVMVLSRFEDETASGTEELQTLCTGTLIGPKTVLTAAHCFPKNTISTQIIASINLFCSSGFNQRLIYPGRKVKIHPQYRHKSNPSTTSPDFDIAVVNFEGILPAEYSPIPLQKIELNQEMNKPSKLIMIGYGRTHKDDDSLPELRYLAKSWPQLILFKDSLNLVDQLGLVGVNQSDSRGGCSGDSGGPLLIEDNGSYRILGVASYIESSSKSKLCEQGQIFYSYIPTYWDWLSEQLP